MRNHRTLIASPLKLSGPCLLIDFGSWRRYPHRLVITDVWSDVKPPAVCIGPLRSAWGPNSAPTKLFAEHSSFRVINFRQIFDLLDVENGVSL